MRIAAYGLLLALMIGAIAAFGIHRQPLYAFDGYAYGIRAQLDAGIPYDRAIAHARTVYAPTPAMRRPYSRRWMYSPIPQWWRLFRVRVLYPWLASLLWTRYDFGALFIVSGLAYVAATLLTYGLLLRIAQPALAALCALVVALLPQSREFGRADLTDMTSYALLVATLWMMARFARSGRGRDFALAAMCALVLSLTRPVPYIVVCAALPLLVTAYRRQGALLAAVGVVLCGAVEIALDLTHADVPFTPNYLAAVAATAHAAADWWYAHPVGLIALGALLVRRREPEALIAFGAWFSILPTMLIDPIPGDVQRVVIFPSLISVACGLGYTAQMLTRAYRATTAARLSALPDRNTRPRGDRPWWRIRTNAS